MPGPRSPSARPDVDGATFPDVADKERCVGCGALVTRLDGPRHAYLNASAGCWAALCLALEWKAQLPGDEAVAIAQDLVDAYAVQHPGGYDRRNRQSVAVHLMSLCAATEAGADARTRRARIGDWTHRVHPELLPSPRSFPITALDVAEAPPDERAPMVKSMALATWSAWSDHHQAVREWLSSSWGGRPD